MTPERIGPYLLEDEIGAGGMGSVYRALDERLGRPVAIKRVRATQDASVGEAARQRFLREAQTVARLSHPAIVQIHDLQTEGDDSWIVMELVAGSSLAEELRSGPLPIEHAVELGHQIAAGLDHAHRLGVLHRDLKPENIMVTPEGQAKILDFGLAKPLAEAPGEPSLTQTGALLGTYRSMSPEQVRGFKLDERSDLFSLGILLYEMVSGVRPFDGQTPQDSLALVCAHYPPDLEQVVPHAPRPLAALVGELLRKDRSRRPESAREVARRLGSMAAPSQGPPVWEPAEDESALLESTQYPLPESPDPSPGPADEPTRARSDPASPKAQPPTDVQHEPSSQPRSRPQTLASPRSWLVAALGLTLVLGIWQPWRSSPEPSTGRAEDSDRAELSPPELFRRGQELLSTYYIRQDLQDAIATFEDLLALEPDSAPAYAGLSRAYWRRYYAESQEPLWLNQALGFAERAVELDEFLVYGRVSLALCLERKGRIDEAEAQAQQVLVLEPQNADAHRVLADVASDRGDLQAAEELSRTALAARPDDADLHDHLGGILWHTARFDEAETLFLRSIELAPNSVAGHRNLGGVYYQQGRLVEASREMQRALEIRPDATLYGSLGVIYFVQGLYSEAAEVFDKAVGAPGGTNNHKVWGNLADAYRWSPEHAHLAGGAYQKAVELILPKVEAAPGNTSLRSQLALFQAKGGAHDEARRELDHLAQNLDLSARENLRVAVAWEVLGDRELALEALSRSLEAGMSTEEVAGDPELRELRNDPRYHQLLGDS